MYTQWKCRHTFTYPHTHETHQHTPKYSPTFTHQYIFIHTYTHTRTQDGINIRRARSADTRSPYVPSERDSGFSRHNSGRRETRRPDSSPPQRNNHDENTRGRSRRVSDEYASPQRNRDGSRRRVQRDEEDACSPPPRRDAEDTPRGRSARRVENNDYSPPRRSQDDRPKSRARHDEYVSSPPQRQGERSAMKRNEDDYETQRDDDGNARGYRNASLRSDRERYAEERVNVDEQMSRAYKTPASRGNNDRVRYADERTQGAMKPYTDRDDVRGQATKGRDWDQAARWDESESSMVGPGLDTKGREGRDHALEEEPSRLARTVVQSQRSDTLLTSSQMRTQEQQHVKSQAYTGDSETQNPNMHNTDRGQQQQNEHLQRENSSNFNGNGNQGYAEVQAFDSDTVNTPRRSHNTSQKVLLRSAVEYKDENTHDADMNTSRRREVDAIHSTNSHSNNTSHVQRMPSASTRQKVMLQGGGREYDAPQGNENNNVQRVQLGSAAHKVMLQGGRDYDIPQGSDNNYNGGSNNGTSAPRDQDLRKRGARMEENNAMNNSMTVCTYVWCTCG
jgi:hypothetical protein